MSRPRPEGQLTKAVAHSTCEYNDGEDSQITQTKSTVTCRYDDYGNLLKVMVNTSVTQENTYVPHWEALWNE